MAALFTSPSGQTGTDTVETAPKMEPSPPSLTVIVRTLGRHNRLADALESLARQEWRDFEVVVVDMSEGKVASTLDQFNTRVPGLRHVALPPSPRPVALNAGIAAARAPRIAILDDDNIYDPGHLAILAEGLADPAVDCVYTGVRHATYSSKGDFVESSDVSIPFEFESLLIGNFIYATGSAYRKAIWERVGGYDNRFTVFEDWDFLIRVAVAGRLRHIPVVSSESRKFTGIPGVANFDLEIAAVRRCHAGIHWKHRRLLDAAARARLKRAYAAHCRRRRPPRKGLLSWTLGGWRLEFGWDLLAWWWGNLPWAAGRRTP